MPTDSKLRWLQAVACGAPMVLGSLPAWAQAGTAQQVEVTGHYDNSLGSSDAASAGTITPQLIESRPLLRPGTLLELIPGMAVTQHSGAGKANQYFLRGFNLDHGTDFSVMLDGVPMNMPTMFLGLLLSSAT